MNVENKTEFQHHLKLITPEKISRDDAKLFVSIIKQTGPDHILKPVEVYDDVGETVSKFYMVKRQEDTSVVIVPLMRDLTEKEAEKIIIVWNLRFDGDYILETSTPYTGAIHQHEEPIEDDDPYLNNDLKEFHFKWTQSLSESGWRYGNKYSRVDKVHPMLLPWEQLPRNYKETYSGILTGILDRTEK